MTELETMKRAKMYIEKLANGIDPLSDEEIKDDSIINNGRTLLASDYKYILRLVIINCCLLFAH